MKKIVFSFLGIVTLAFSSCFNKNHVDKFPDTPAIVTYYNFIYPMIITPYGPFLALELQDVMGDELKEGDAIWASFHIEYRKQSPSAPCYAVSNMIWNKIGKGFPVETTGGVSITGDYDVPIEKLILYNALLEDVLFFGFQHKAPTDQEFIYEMTYYQNEDHVTTFYLRAKKIDAGSESTETITYHYAFDMSNYFSLHKDSQNIIRFKLMFKTGVDSEGNDKYEPYFNNGNPIIEINVE